MVKFLLLTFFFAAVILRIESSPVKEHLYPSKDAIFNLKHHGDIRLTKEQEEKLKDPNVGWISTFWRWPTNLQGQVVVPYAFNSQAGFSKFSVIVMLVSSSMLL
jgi:hypothetical protein